MKGQGRGSLKSGSAGVPLALRFAFGLICSSDTTAMDKKLSANQLIAADGRALIPPADAARRK